jgi:large subunit ribosomal protein L10
MPISRHKKEEVVDKLSHAFREAKSLVFVNFRGLNVGKTAEMRRGLKNEGISYTVAKKTLTRRALDAQKFEGSIPELEGELALAWGDDLIVPARGIHSFMKKFPESLKILGGVFEGRYMSAEEMGEIATIPPLEILRGKFVYVLNSPIQKLAVSLGEITKSRS